MALLRLLTLCAPLAQGIDYKQRGWRSSPQAGFAPARADSRERALSGPALRYFSALENASSKRPVLLMTMDSRQVVQIGGNFQPSAEFQIAGEAEGEAGGERQEQGQGSGLPWGIGSPRNGDSPPLEQYSGMPALDFPKYGEYSLEAGGNIQTFSSARQDVKLITQVLENITNGFYVDSNGGDGEIESNTLLLELTGWRGLIMEPNIYLFAGLWGKIRKAWIFLGCMSPHENATKIGFDTAGNIDMLSGHQTHAYSLATFLAEMGGRKSVDFWNLKNGHYEAEVLQETLLGSGKEIQIGVVLVNFDGRAAGRGDQSYVQLRSKDETEELIWEIFDNASFNYIGGLDARWADDVVPRYQFNDHVFVNPAYFKARDMPVPTAIKSAPPPPAQVTSSERAWHWNAWRDAWDEGYSQDGELNTWDEGYSQDEEVDKIVAYIARARQQAAPMEAPAVAHRLVAVAGPGVACPSCDRTNR